VISDLRPLTQDERQTAYDAARAAVLRAVGEQPDRAQFTHHTTSKYPAWVIRLFAVLCLVLLLAAFTPSAIRLYVIGSQTFGLAVNNTAAQTLVGLATVLSAEIGQVVFSLALATLGTSRSARRLLYTSMAISTLIALVGNIQLALPGHTGSPFAWLESIAPPLLVLFVSYVLKSQMLDSIYQRHANEQAYQQALHAWQQATAAPETHIKWNQFYANALRDTLRKANSRKKDALEAATNADWRALIWRELQADSWYEAPTVKGDGAQLNPTLLPALEAVTSANGNGHHGAGNGNGSA